MRRSPRFVLATVAAVAVAATTTYVVFTDLQTLRHRARDLGPPRTVVVATRDLPLGATVTAEVLRVVTVHESAAPRGALADIDDAVGRVVAIPLPRDAYLHGAHLAAADRDGIDGLVPADHRAVRLTPSDGLRPPVGALVDVWATIDAALVAPGATPGAPAGSLASGALPVASAARVLAVDAAGEYAGATAAGVTLLVTEGEARDLAFASASGTLMLALAPPEAACC